MLTLGDSHWAAPHVEPDDPAGWSAERFFANLLAACEAIGAYCGGDPCQPPAHAATGTPTSSNANG